MKIQIESEAGTFTAEISNDSNTCEMAEVFYGLMVCSGFNALSVLEGMEDTAESHISAMKQVSEE